MKDVMVSLPEDTLRWASTEAARHEITVSKFVTDLLIEMQRREEAYDTSMSRLFNRPAEALRRIAEPMPSRDSLYER